MNDSFGFAYDPDIYDWCTDQRISRLHSHFAELAPILSWSNLLSPALRAWVKQELLQDFLDKSQLHEVLVDPQLLDQKLIQWAESLWDHRLETIYLSQKDQLDRYTLKMLRVTDQYLSFELFNRIKANEAPFEQLSWSFGEGPERSYGGLLKDKRLQDLPPALHKLIKKLQPGEVLKPYKLGNWFVILSLVDWTPAQFDQRTKALLLKCELNRWLDAVVQQLQSHLK